MDAATRELIQDAIVKEMRAHLRPALAAGKNLDEAARQAFPGHPAYLRCLVVWQLRDEFNDDFWGDQAERLNIDVPVAETEAVP